jgi:hypothetical protein
MIRPLLKTFLPIAIAWSFSMAAAQNLPLTTITSVPGTLSETSGLVATGPNKLWSHNDSGGDPKLYCFDTTGTLLRTLVVRNASNVDWEEITSDAQGRFYIGDFGNNDNNRSNLRIYRIPPPDSVVGDSVTAEIIDFDYPDQAAFPPPDSLKKFDMEAMVTWGDSVYLFSKNRTAPFDGYTRCYRLPQDPGTYTAVLCDSFFCGTGSMIQHWVTAAALSPNGEHLVLLSSDRCWLFSCFTGSDFFGGSNVELGFALSQKEGIDWRDDNVAYITDELVSGVFGGKLYRGDFSLWTAEPSVFLGNDTTVGGGSLLLDATSVAGASYIWNTGATTAALNVSISGTYSVTVTAPNGCTATDTITVLGLTNLSPKGPSQGMQFEVSPQPSPETFILKYELSLAETIWYEVVDLQGRTVLSTSPREVSAGKYSEQINLPTPGSYVLRMYHGEYLMNKRIWRID